MEKIIRQLIDDLEGEEVEADGTIQFGLDGKHYEIDLSKKNATKLRGHLQPFINAARPLGRKAAKEARTNGNSISARGGPSGYSTDQLKAVRDWARNNGFPDLSDKGRVPAEVLEAFATRAGKSTDNKLFSAV